MFLESTLGHPPPALLGNFLAYTGKNLLAFVRQNGFTCSSLLEAGKSSIRHRRQWAVTSGGGALLGGAPLADLWSPSLSSQVLFMSSWSMPPKAIFGSICRPGDLLG